MASSQNPPTPIDTSALVPNQEKERPATRMVGIKKPNSCMIYRIATALPDLKSGDSVMLDTRDGHQIGQITFASDVNYGLIARTSFPGRIKRVLRKLSPEELHNIEEKKGHERKASALCRKKVVELGLKMRLSTVKYAYDENKAIFFFTADNRVDFRELVRVLARQLKIRVEMRQIGVRDEARLLGGIGPCGDQLCCSAFMKRFHTVSVRMAKNQELSLNPDTISGLCGRLLCCLGHEDKAYKDIRRALPKTNTTMTLPDGREGVVRGVHPLKKTIDLHLSTGERVSYSLKELNIVDPDHVDGEEIEDIAPKPFPSEFKENQEKAKNQSSRVQRREHKPEQLTSKKHHSNRKKQTRKNHNGPSQSSTEKHTSAPLKQNGQNSPNKTEQQHKQEQAKEGQAKEEQKKEGRRKRSRRRRSRHGRPHGDKQNQTNPQQKQNVSSSTKAESPSATNRQEEKEQTKQQTKNENSPKKERGSANRRRRRRRGRKNHSKPPVNNSETSS
ncbi:MAG: hypothetical protein HQL54_03145 [Magnetococcales bacterium]|nr:hypothetical protein [Magnetococcales bacterium]